MYKKLLFLWAALAVGALSLQAGCGGSSSTSSTQATAVSRGTITSVTHSITVNGVEFNTSGAAITLDDPSDATTLLPGMLVTVKGRFDDDIRGTAFEVKVANELKGPIAAFNNLSSTMTVLDQKVRFDPATTVFNNFSGGTTSSTVRTAPGQMVRVNGFYDPQGTIHATFVQRKLPDWTPATVVSIRGPVGSIGASSFTIGALTVNFTGTLPAGIVVGSFVKVKGTIATIASPTLTATSVELLHVDLQDEAPNGAQVVVEGMVFNLSGNTFTVAGTPVNAGIIPLTGISNGTLVIVKGTMVNGVLLATKIIMVEPFFTQTNLVSNIPGVATTTDPNLVNSWGIAHSPTGPWWVNDNATGVTTVYDNLGHPFPVATPLIVTNATVPGGTVPAPVTGIVFNNYSGFDVTAGVAATSAKFISVTEDGSIVAWNTGTTSTLKVNNFVAGAGAVYKGAALATNGTANFLYVANFRGASVDIFDSNYAPVTKAAGAFTDATIPAGYAPFNIANIGGNLYVSYAMQDAALHDDVAGQGHGFVTVYSPTGTLLRRLQGGLWLNSPWGMAMAPADFGKFGNMLLVGNFGSGQIAVYDPISGTFLGLLRDIFNDPIAISGLWGLGFGNGGTAGATNTLFFAAGLNGESDGLFGTLTTSGLLGQAP